MLYAVIKGALWGEAAEVARQAAEEVRLQACGFDRHRKITSLAC